MAELETEWPDIIAFIALILCFFTTIFLKNSLFAYIIILLTGLIFGRIWYKFRKASKTAITIIILGSILGFITALFFKKPQLVIIVLIFGIFLGYWAHKKKYIKSVEY